MLRYGPGSASRRSFDLPCFVCAGVVCHGWDSTWPGVTRSLPQVMEHTLEVQILVQPIVLLLDPSTDNSHEQDGVLTVCHRLKSLCLLHLSRRQRQ